MTERSAEEIKILLKKNLIVSEENHKLLRTLHRSSKFKSILSLIYLIILLGGLAWTYNFAKPYFDRAKGSYDSYQQSQSRIQDLINKYLPGK